MKRKILKIMGVFAAGMLILGIAGCGAKAPTTADDLTQDEQQKITAGTETVTVGTDTELAVN